jgi:hypothetical protein
MVLLLHLPLDSQLHPARKRELLVARADRRERERERERERKEFGKRSRT